MVTKRSELIWYPCHVHVKMHRASQAASKLGASLESEDVDAKH